MQGMRFVFRQPLIDVQKIILFAPEHAGQRLTHDVRRIRTHRWRSHRTVKFIGLSESILEDLVKGRSKDECIPVFAVDGAGFLAAVVAPCRTRRTCAVADWPEAILNR